MYTGRWLFGLLVGSTVVGQTPAPPRTALAHVQRVCVDKFTGEDVLTAPVREIAIAALFGLKRFAITENCARADATLKGAVLERATERVRGEGETTGFGTARGVAAANRSRAVAAIAGNAGLADEQLYSAESGTAASVTLRLVTQDGDVLWAYTQDSPGGKSRGAVADAVERAVKQLERELNRTRPAAP